jgi:FkbM family methyltransferase
MSHFLSNTTLIRRDRLKELRAREAGFFDLQFIRAMQPDHRNACLDLLDRSRSQLRQDIFALAASGFRKNGFFVEFGATDGLELNNSWLPEAEFGWTGILAEPARMWHDDLKRNRSCIIDTRCVWRESGETLSFSETPRGENSGISEYVPTRRRLRGTSYEVETISLADLLIAHDAPAQIDYISIDTEGSEYEILKGFDFDRWQFGALTIEHNFAAQRDDIHALLTAKGYMRVHETVSRFDDWYVRA